MTRLLRTARDRYRDRDDAGMTMIELLITSTVLVILLGMVFISMDLINNVSTNVTSPPAPAGKAWRWWNRSAAMCWPGCAWTPPA